MGSLKDDALESSAPFVDSSYYGDAEKWTPLWWNYDLPFRSMFDQLDTTVTVDLAAGYGRHAEYAAPLTGQLILMDVIERNIKVCKVRLASRYKNIQYIVNNGFDYRPLQDASVTSIFCYDAMVHFSAAVVKSYLNDTSRILKNGGRALFHHSNYDGPQMDHFGKHPHARQRLTQSEFHRLAIHAGLRICMSKIIPWAEVKDLDCITLVEKIDVL
jgi:SAM-dependent methyltransferase